MQGERTDPTSLRETLALLAATGRGAGAGRARHLARTATAGRAGARAIARAVCEVGALMAERLRLGAGVRQGLAHNQERWDGRGAPTGWPATTVAARVAMVATQVVVFDRLGGPEAAAEMVRRRAGGWFDPAVAAAFERAGPGMLRRLATADVWAEVLEAEPEPARRVPPAGIDEVAHAFGDMVDLLTPSTLGHAAAVAELTAQASARLGLAATDAAQLRRAALLHDLGRVAVSSGVGSGRAGCRPPSGSGSGCTPTTASGSWSGRPPSSPWPGWPACITSATTAPATTTGPPAPGSPPEPGCWPPPTPTRR